MQIVTQELLFESNVKQIVKGIETDYNHEIMQDFHNCPQRYPDLFSWLCENPEIVGKAFMKHLINYGITEQDIDDFCAS